MVRFALLMQNDDPKRAVILLAHGTRDPEASKPVHDYAKKLASVVGMTVEPCLREFIEPSVPTVVKKLIEQGMERIVVIPFFLFQSAHVTRDIQKDLSIEKGKYPNVEFAVGEPIGYDDAMVDLLQRRLEAAL